jgi:hypothetical protein
MSGSRAEVPQAAEIKSSSEDDERGNHGRPWRASAGKMQPGGGNTNQAGDLFGSETGSTENQTRESENP